MVWHAVTAIVFCSIGVLVGGFISSSKVAYLYDALERAELAYSKQSKNFEEIIRLSREVMATLRPRTSSAVDSTAIDRIVASLEIQLDEAIARATLGSV